MAVLILTPEEGDLILQALEKFTGYEDFSMSRTSITDENCNRLKMSEDLQDRIATMFDRGPPQRQINDYVPEVRRTAPTLSRGRVR